MKYVIPLLALICIIMLFLLGPIPQDQHYHNFADTVKHFGILNFFNVLTNLPFAIVGFFGLQAIKHFKKEKLKYILITLFTAFLLLTIGSSYYHLTPSNDTLVYDRIPMVIIFMSFFAFIIYMHIGKRTGYQAFIVFNILGILSIIYWILSEHAGKGDLRWYGMFQVFPIITIPLILLLYKTSFNYWKEIIFIFLFFGLAKVAEKFDKEMYHFLGNIISGHSLKHLLMAAAEYEIVIMVRHSKFNNSLNP